MLRRRLANREPSSAAQGAEAGEDAHDDGLGDGDDEDETEMVMR